MKKDYSAPEMEIVALNDEDIVTASGPQSVNNLTRFDPFGTNENRT